MSAEVRRARESDWPRVRELCCATGKAGAPIEAAPGSEDWLAFSETWIGPYRRHFPEWTFVAERGARVVGYVTGCPDTALLDRLTQGLPLGELQRRTRSRFAPEVVARIAREFPAHLHVNLEAESRGERLGAQLIERLEAELAGADVRGLHLYCRQGPLRFYERAGFSRLGERTAPDGKPVFALAKAL